MLEFSGARKPDFSDIKRIDYEEYWLKRGFRINSKLKAREEMILGMIEPGAKIIDIGCGNSLLPVKLKEKGCEVAVADISEIVLKNYAGFGIDGKIIDLGKISENDFAGVYDYIILNMVIEHTGNPEEIIKALKPHAVNFIITVPNSAFYRYRWHLLFHGRFFTQWAVHPSEHLRYWSHVDFLDWLEALDLKVIKAVSTDGFSLFGLCPGLKNYWKNLFGHLMLYHCKTGNNGKKL